jgi:hypothetical protein
VRHDLRNSVTGLCRATYSLLVTLAASFASTFDPGFGPGSDGLFSGFPTGFLVALGLVAALIAAGFVFIVYSAVRNARRLRQAGIDPLTAQSELLIGLRQSPLLAGGPSLEDRLAEVDRLYQAGKISQAEHQQARAALLGGSASA